MSVRVRLVFPEELVRQPIIARMVREHEVEPNIRRASVEEHSGWIICELDGAGESIVGALDWLTSIGVRVEQLSDVVEG